MSDYLFLSENGLRILPVAIAGPQCVLPEVTPPTRLYDRGAGAVPLSPNVHFRTYLLADRHTYIEVTRASA